MFPQTEQAAKNAHKIVSAHKAEETAIGDAENTGQAGGGVSPKGGCGHPRPHLYPDTQDDQARAVLVFPRLPLRRLCLGAAPGAGGRQLRQPHLHPGRGGPPRSAEKPGAEPLSGTAGDQPV